MLIEGFRGATAECASVGLSLMQDARGIGVVEQSRREIWKTDQEGVLVSDCSRIIDHMDHACFSNQS